MEITKEDFLKCKSISVDTSYASPVIIMCSDVDNKQLIHKFECDNKEKADELFSQLLNAWKEARDGT